MRIGARGELSFKRLFRLAVVQSGDARLPCLQANQHFRQFPVRRRSGNHRDIRRALEDSLPFLLRHTAQDNESFTRSMQFLVIVQPIEDFLFRLVADGAGVVQDQVGGSLGIYLGIALMTQSADDFLRVMYVHLAAESLEIKRLVGCHGETEYTAVCAGHGCPGGR